MKYPSVLSTSHLLKLSLTPPIFASLSLSLSLFFSFFRI
ncbi:hypothetical protein TorRG33x02_198980 [Trema orientale]|uniref:Uncharacterized protein n=1 Tax=Trema orientale TaxID=63057 RepID=A0A2P5EFK5_TREOI|nr:hypothetical protein TorRG33x02_198980 [Trema orientale]